MIGLLLAVVGPIIVALDESADMKPTPPPCPKCGSESKAIVYGFPDGMCIITEDSPAYRCKKGHEFGRVELPSGGTEIDAETVRSIWLGRRKK